MIICDAKYLAELRRIERAERKGISRADWIAIDTEIGLLWEQPDQVLFRSNVASLVFRLNRKTLQHRTEISTMAVGKYQGQIPKDGRHPLGTWFQWAAVNKDTQKYRTWRDPDDMIEAFRLSHAIVRYLELRQRFTQPQTKLDKRSLENDNETLRQ